MTTDLAQLAKQEGIRYFLICFADLFGNASLQARAGAGDRRHAA